MAPRIVWMMLPKKIIGTSTTPLSQKVKPLEKINEFIKNK